MIEELETDKAEKLEASKVLTRKSFLQMAAGTMATIALDPFSLAHAGVPLGKTTSQITSLNFGINNPYANVNWATYGQYKSNLHTHTVNSDGNSTQAVMFQQYQNLKYDFLAFTDHDFITCSWPNYSINNGKVNTASGVGGTSGLAAINGWKTSDIIAIKGQEVSKTGWENHHFLSYFSDFISDGTAPNCESLLKQCAAFDANGIQVLAHPGRYAYHYYLDASNTMYDSPRYSDPSNADHANVDKYFFNIGSTSYNVQSSPINPQIVSWYVRQYTNIPSLVGIEVLNFGNQYKRDRELWDNILTQTMPNRPVWGYANDDSHKPADVNRDMECFLLPSKTVADFKTAMKNGNFYISSRFTLPGLGYGTAGANTSLALPKITNISVNASTGDIVITGTNYNTITWISCGAVVGTGNTINCKTATGVSKYVRAVLTGTGGESFTQPFGIVGR